jgi:predicted lipoprotein with Yx(FWY)xxD motif
VKAVPNKKLGVTVLVDQRGRTLYHFTVEKGKKIACTGACATFWPPLLIASTAKPKIGKGATKKKLGTIRRPDGSLQVTYSWFALYRYGSDKKPGDVKGEGVQKVWYAISPTGKLVTKAKKGSAG